MERIVDRREPGMDPAAALQLGLELSQREIGRRLDQPTQVGCVGREHAPPVAAVARRRGAARGADPLHELDGGRPGRAPVEVALGQATKTAGLVMIRRLGVACVSVLNSMQRGTSSAHAEP
jgi:hypothetical protein